MAMTVEQAQAAFDHRNWVRLAVKNGATTQVCWGRITMVNPPNSAAIMAYREGEDVKQARHLGWVRLEDISLLETGG